jgi:YHS domain-containing protein
MTMSNDASIERQRDPVCGMNVRIDAAVPDGLLTEHEGHTYYFCRAACLDEFTAAPDRFTASHGHAADAATMAQPEIDDGMRRWYESCSCCLSDAYPDVKAALDAERAADQPPAGPGICEVAEAGEVAEPASS